MAESALVDTRTRVSTGWQATAILVGLITAALLFAGVRSLRSGDGPQQFLIPSYRGYESVDELAGEADLVVLGRVGEVLGRDNDHGLSASDGGEAGVPMIFVSVEIGQVLLGDDPGVSEIAVASLDVTILNVEGVSQLRDGQDVVLFLLNRDQETAPGIDLVDDFYVTLSGDNGIFDVDGDKLSSRSPVVRGLSDVGILETGPGDRMQFRLGDVTQRLSKIAEGL
ncbi:MAG: hypothetical protein OXL98_14535 [Acidimicrobiaceae bacterium]|nr:hypothetical protein [Acidimicrobiaceae bacterium]